MTRAGSSGRGCLAQQRKQRLGQREHALDVDRQDPVPRRQRKLLQRRTPVGTGVVDQRVDALLTRRQGGGERLDALDGAEIGRNGVHLAVRAQLLDRGVEVGLLAAADVDPDAAADESFRDHLADAASATGDDGDLTGQGIKRFGQRQHEGSPESLGRAGCCVAACSVWPLRGAPALAAARRDHQRPRRGRPAPRRAAPGPPRRHQAKTTQHHDRARGNLDRHGVHFLTAYSLACRSGGQRRHRRAAGASTPPSRTD